MEQTLDKILSVRVTAEDKETIRQAAKQDRRDMADWCRLTLLDAARAADKKPALRVKRD